ncbi:hypothetical protein C900_00866 [Fulvivirga imtechensis AK7]|uniref:Uncharacterized protein n=1 Tax=Fulvivirga imtechensis AK7 TaxID=1237149 RepID=L8JVS2_9BACT|nr:hypothetical protein C900_00866 [Fulvivirga imtechensis AK7]
MFERLIERKIAVGFLLGLNFKNSCLVLPRLCKGEVEKEAAKGR